MLLRKRGPGHERVSTVSSRADSVCRRQQRGGLVVTAPHSTVDRVAHKAARRSRARRFAQRAHRVGRNGRHASSTAVLAHRRAVRGPWRRQGRARRCERDAWWWGCWRCGGAAWDGCGPGGATEKVAAAVIDLRAADCYAKRLPRGWSGPAAQAAQCVLLS